MKTFANWMTVIFMIMFWIFRIITAYFYQTSRTWICTPLNMNIEIVMLFITFICIILVFKRKKVGGFIYVVTTFLYFGADAFKVINPLLDGESFNINIGMSLFISVLAIILSVVVLMDVLSYNLKSAPNKKTEWFYNNKDLDRKTDNGEDKNNYRFY